MKQELWSWYSVQRCPTTPAFSSTLTDVMPFSPARTLLFADYEVLLSRLEKQEGFPLFFFFFFATVMMIMRRKEDCVQKPESARL